jgi:hypothetical protein
LNYLITFNQQLVRQKLHTHFRFRASCFILLALLSGSVRSGAQDSAGIAKYKLQLQLIDSIKSYITSDLGMYVQSTFYTSWRGADADSMHIFFYISRGDRVEKDTVNKIPWYFEKESNAIAKSKEMSALGYHTLVYKTAGMANTLLTPKLLSYPNEAIAFIVFHEAVHQNLAKMGGTVHYNYEEALCDVIANMACVRFAEKKGMIDVHAAEKQRDVFERSYSFLNKERSMLDTMQPHNKPALYRTCSNIISDLTADANQFVKDRMDYEVNNAYFLRIQDYAANYFKVKKLFAVSFNFKDIVGRIEEWQNK